MRSVEPSDNDTVPVPVHAPSKPANGPDGWAWLAETEKSSAAPMPAALIASPVRPMNFIANIPFWNDARLRSGTSRHIESLVLRASVRFKAWPPEMAARDVQRQPRSADLPCFGIFLAGKARRTDAALQQVCSKTQVS
jgi:hypothetical protein